MAINFTDSPADGATQVIGGRTYTYNSAKNKWDTTATEVVGPTATTYATVNDLPGTATTGDQAFVSGTNRLYIWNGSGWYNIALVNNTPTWTNQPSSSYNLATDGTATTITIVATDPEGLPITYSIASDTSGNIATVTQGTGLSANTFTITPSTSNADAGTFSLTFRATDGINVASAISSFTLQFTVENQKYTTALITSVGANNATNSLVADNSTNDYGFALYGTNSTQGTFSPYRHGGNSVLFPGGDQGDGYLDMGAAIVPATGSWTYQSWIKVNQHSNGTHRHSLLQWYTNSQSGRGGIEVRGHSETNPGLLIVIVEGMTAYPYSTTRLDDGLWHHVAVERDGNVWSVWIDGTREDQITQSVSVYQGVNTRIGQGVNTTGTNFRNMDGEMRDVRFSTSARYSGAATITVPTEDETDTTGYSLLCCQSFDPFVDKTDTYTISVVAVNVPVKQVGAGPYDSQTYTAADHGSSYYFGGLGNHVASTSGTGVAAPGGGDFCLEFWVYPTSSGISSLFDYRPYNANPASGLLLFKDASNRPYLYANASQRILATDDIPVNVWSHIAVTRNSGTHYLYVNGKQQSGTWTDSTTWTTGAYRPIFMQSGFHAAGNSPGNYYNTTGNMTDIRLVTGSPVYTTDFTPPTAPLTAITNTQLLLNAERAGIIDKSQSVQTLTLNGDVKSSTTQTKYLTSSMYFDGTGDYITASPGDDIAAFGTGDFTVEGWFYVESGDEYPFALEFRSTDPQAAGLLYFWNYGNGNVDWYIDGASRILGTSAGVDTWQHIAVCRSGTSTKMFINGTQSGSTYTDTNNYVAGSTLYIGQRFNSVRPYKGYMSDIRITKGLARYTANFTPPTAELKG